MLVSHYIPILSSILSSILVIYKKYMFMNIYLNMYIISTHTLS